jgi:hypothetical protein
MDRLLVTNKEESAFLNAKRSQGQLETPQPLSVPTYTYIYLLNHQSTYLPTYLRIYHACVQLSVTLPTKIKVLSRRMMNQDSQ